VLDRVFDDPANAWVDGAADEVLGGFPGRPRVRHVPQGASVHELPAHEVGGVVGAGSAGVDPVPGLVDPAVMGLGRCRRRTRSAAGRGMRPVAGAG